MAFNPLGPLNAGLYRFPQILVTLMCFYLLVGNDPKIARTMYLKNRPANIFYKTKLSSIRQNIVNLSYPKRVLYKRDRRALLYKLLLDATNRKEEEPLFLEHDDPRPQYKTSPSNVMVNTWIREVLTGADDQIFDEMRNPWSVEIQPDAQNEAIVEIRRIGQLVPLQPNKTYALEDANNGLLAYLKTVYLANRVMKQTH